MTNKYSPRLRHGVRRSAIPDIGPIDYLLSIDQRFEEGDRRPGASYKDRLSKKVDDERESVK